MGPFGPLILKAMRFVGLVRSSLIEYPPYISHIVFVPGCIFRCDYCYNKSIVEDNTEEIYSQEEIINMIKYDNKFSSIVKGLVISGGEPLLYQEELKDFIDEIKKLKIFVRIDTTGALENKNFLEKLNGISITLKPFSYYSKDYLQNLIENIKLSQNLNFNYLELRLTLTQENYLDVLKTFELIKNIIDFKKWNLKVIKAKFIEESVHIGKFTLLKDNLLLDICKNMKKYPFKNITFQK